MSIDPISHAITTIRSNYGDDVSIKAKRKGLLKFGSNAAVGTNADGYTLMTLAGSERHESYVSDNLITHFASSDASDDQEIVIEGHTISGNILTFQTQTVTLNGTTKTALDTPLARVTRLYNNGSTDFAGTIYVARDVTFTDGVPQTDSAVHLIVDSGNQSEKASTSLSSTDYWIVTKIYADVLKKTAGFADVQLQVRTVGKVFRSVARFASSSGRHEELTFMPYLVIPKNSDVRLVAVADATAEVSGGIHGFLAKVVP